MPEHLTICALQSVPKTSPEATPFVSTWKKYNYKSTRRWTVLIPKAVPLFLIEEAICLMDPEGEIPGLEYCSSSGLL